MNRKVIFWVLFAAVQTLYLVIVLWSLPQIMAEASGIRPFDMRPGGYSLTDAQAFLAALSAEGRDFYFRIQQRLDLVYPALLAAMFALGFAMLFRGWPRQVLWALAFAVMAFDYLENRAVAGLLGADPAAIDAAIVAAASRWTVLKSAATSLAYLALLGGALRLILRRRRKRAR